MIEGRRRAAIEASPFQLWYSRHAMLVRVGGSIVSCVLVAALTFLAAWIELGRSFAWAFNSTPSQAEYELDYMGREIERIVADQGSPPTELSKLDLAKLGLSQFAVDGSPLDPWGRPYLYVVDGTEFRLGSLGPDGEAGGEGINADIHYGQTEHSTPTLAQFALELPTQGSQLACLIGGVFAGAATWFLLKPSLVLQGSLWSTLIPLIVTLGMSAVTALGMAAAHIPSGH
jgi:general secretion pathway protein G